MDTSGRLHSLSNERGVKGQISEINLEVRMRNVY